MHLKPGHGQGQHAHAQDGHGGDLGPQERKPGALEKDALGDDDKVHQGVEIGQVLKEHRHVGDGKDEPGQEDGRGEKQIPGHHSLLLGG